MRRLLAVLIMLAMASCGSEEEAASPEASAPLLTEVLCPPVLQKLEKIDAQIRKLSKGAQETGELGGVRTVGEARLSKIERANEQLLRVRSRAAALGCLPA